MPFVSQSQRAFMHIHHPEIAKEFEKKTPKGEKLPEHVSSAYDMKKEQIKKKG